MRMILFLLVLFNFSIGQADRKNAIKNVRECLKNWGEHPFSLEKPKFRIIESSVSVLGIGGGVKDNKKTSKPELIYVKPSVDVLTKSTMELLNPKGWYCLKTKVSVLGKSIIKLCKTSKFTLSKKGATVLGSDKGKEAKGTTVLGKAVIKRVGCSG